jgi:DNA-binding GntR family transcriptional regulator
MDQDPNMTRAAKAQKSPSSLHRQLASQILRYIRGNKLAPGARLREVALAQEFKVSRTPVRAALGHLARQGIVDASSHRGYAVGQGAEELETVSVDQGKTDDDALYMQLTKDYLEQRLEKIFTEADLVRRHKVPYSLLQRVLHRMAADLVIERNPGNGWRFGPGLTGEGPEKNSSLRFRLLIEPACLLEPGYSLDPARARLVRQDHEAIIALPRNKLSSVNIFHFYEMNAEFHELLAAGSNNPFLVQAVQQQNRLRRLVVYNWVYPLERIVESCLEHMEILTAVEKHDMERAATLMRRHLGAAYATEVVKGPKAAPNESGNTRRRKRR